MVSAGCPWNITPLLRKAQSGPPFVCSPTKRYSTADHVVRERRLVEEVAEAVVEGGVLVLVVDDLQDPVLDAEGVAVVHADLVAGDLRDPPVEALAVEEGDPLFLVRVSVFSRPRRPGVRRRDQEHEEASGCLHGSR
jgi:hypothetical protein